MSEEEVYDLETVRENMAALEARQRARSAAARAQREADDQTAQDATRARRNAASRARRAATPKTATRRRYRSSARTRERQREAARVQRHAQAVEAGTASPLAVERNRQRLTQTALAALRPELTRHIVQRMESGDPTISAAQWALIADALGVALEVVRP